MKFLKLPISFSDKITFVRRGWRSSTISRILFWLKSRIYKRYILKGRTYLQILQLIREVFEELDVFDLVLGGVDAEKVFQMDDFCDVSDVVLAKV